MLENLIINNGTMTPVFNKEITSYDITINSSETYLDINYLPTDNSEVNIIGNNNLNEGNSIVLIEVLANEKITTYTLNVYKETTVTSIENIPLEPLEVTKELPTYVAPSIAIVCFLIILLTFRILFIRKRK